MPRVGVRELAQVRGVTHPAVLRAEASGRISRRGPDGKFDLERSMREWDGATDTTKPRNSVTGDPKHRKGEPEVPRIGAASDEQVQLNVQTQQSRAIREHYAALREKMAYEREVGKLVDADELRPALFEVLTVATNTMRTVSSRIVPSLPGGTDPPTAAKMKKAIDTEMEKTIGAMRLGFTQLQNPKTTSAKRRGRPRRGGRSR